MNHIPYVFLVRQNTINQTYLVKKDNSITYILHCTLQLNLRIRIVSEVKNTICIEDLLRKEKVWRERSDAGGLFALGVFFILRFDRAWFRNQ